MTLNFSPFPELVTERLILRKLRQSDAGEIFTLRSNKEVNRYINRTPPLGLGEVRKFIQKINDGIRENSWIYWAICPEADENLIGTICIWNFSGDGSVAEVGYELIPDFHGYGFMNEALKRVLDFGFGKLCLKKIEAFTHSDNTKSTRLLERNQFILETGRKDDKNAHYIIYSLTRLQ